MSESPEQETKSVTIAISTRQIADLKWAIYKVESRLRWSRDRLKSEDVEELRTLIGSAELIVKTLHEQVRNASSENICEFCLTGEWEVFQAGVTVGCPVCGAQDYIGPEPDDPNPDELYERYVSDEWDRANPGGERFD